MARPAVTRDDQESRASRDTLPGYAFLPDGKSLVVPIGGKLQRVDFETGAARVIPMTVPVKAEIAARVYTPVRMEDGDSRPGSADPLALGVAGWRARGVQRDEQALYRGSAQRQPPPADERAGPQDRRRGEGEFMPSWSPDGRSIVYATWTTRGGHIKRVPAGGGAAETLTRFEGYYLDPAFTPDGSKVVFLSGAVSDQLYSILLDTPPDGDVHREPDAIGEIGGISPPNTLEIRWMPASGGASTFVAAAQSGRRPHFVNERLVVASS